MQDALKGRIVLFKDSKAQNIIENILMNNPKAKNLDLSELVDLFVHSYHIERFTEVLIASLGLIQIPVTSLSANVILDR